jgi:hypothetical protein
MVGEALDYAPNSPKVTAAIDATAAWFEFLLENIGVQPSSIPTLLRWQYQQGELLYPDNKED